MSDQTPVKKPRSVSPTKDKASELRNRFRAVSELEKKEVAIEVWDRHIRKEFTKQQVISILSTSRKESDIPLQYNFLNSSPTVPAGQTHTPPKADPTVPKAPAKIEPTGQISSPPTAARSKTTIEKMRNIAKSLIPKSAPKPKTSVLQLGPNVNVQMNDALNNMSRQEVEKNLQAEQDRLAAHAAGDGPVLVVPGKSVVSEPTSVVNQSQRQESPENVLKDLELEEIGEIRQFEETRGGDREEYFSIIDSYKGSLTSSLSPAEELVLATELKLSLENLYITDYVSALKDIQDTFGSSILKLVSPVGIPVLENTESPDMETMIKNLVNDPKDPENEPVKGDVAISAMASDPEKGDPVPAEQLSAEPADISEGPSGAERQTEVEVPAAFHVPQVSLLLGNPPIWDAELTKNLTNAGFSEQVRIQMMTSIINVYGPKMFVYSRVGNSLQELNELIQMQYCLERNLQRGTRVKTATVPISSLLEMGQKLSAGVNQTVQKLPTPLSKPLSKPVVRPTQPAFFAPRLARKGLLKITQTDAISQIQKVYDYGRYNPSGTERIRVDVAADTTKRSVNILGTESQLDPTRQNHLVPIRKIVVPKVMKGLC